MLKPAPSGLTGRDQRSRPLLRTMLGDVLRRTRLEQRRTLADVARAARVSMPYLSEVERGRKEASSEVLAAICDALRIELPDLLAEVRRDLVESRNGRRRPDRLVRLDAIRDRVGNPDPAQDNAMPLNAPAVETPLSPPAEARCLLAA